jgi:hypothetical protein
MITKRWKTAVTGDENSMRKIMQILLQILLFSYFLLNEY